MLTPTQKKILELLKQSDFLTAIFQLPEFNQMLIQSGFTQEQVNACAQVAPIYRQILDDENSPITALFVHMFELGILSSFMELEKQETAAAHRLAHPTRADYYEGRFNAGNNSGAFPGRNGFTLLYHKDSLLFENQAKGFKLCDKITPEKAQAADPVDIFSTLKF